MATILSCGSMVPPPVKVTMPLSSAKVWLRNEKDPRWRLSVPRTSGRARLPVTLSWPRHQGIEAFAFDTDRIIRARGDLERDHGQKIVVAHGLEPRQSAQKRNLRHITAAETHEGIDDLDIALKRPAAKGPV